MADSREVIPGNDQVGACRLTFSNAITNASRISVCFCNRNIYSQHIFGFIIFEGPQVSVSLLIIMVHFSG